MINRETAKQFLEAKGYPNPDSNFENELLDTMVEYAQQQVKNNDLLHDVSHTVIYDNFGRDWREPKEKYQIMEVLKDGYLIGNECTKPFFAYEYQIKTCG